MPTGVLTLNEAIAELFRYNAWANEQLLGACLTLSEEQLDTHLPSVSGSVRELLVHLAGAQQTFVLRTKGRQHEGELTRTSNWPGFEVLLDVIHTTDQQLLEISERLREGEEVDLPYVGKVFRYPKRFFLLHALEHGIEHRTEIRTALRHVGVETPDLDAWTYSSAAGYGQEVP
jgi:uncharacterized damage-inducible protein DinB